MAIRSRDGLIAAIAAGQTINLMRSGARTTIATATFETIDLAGQPGSGVLAGTSTAAGIVPTDATVGCPTINAFAGSNSGYITEIAFASSVACRLRLSDLLFKAGAYAFNAAVALAAQPSYSSRVPGGADYTGTQIWFECVTAFTGNPSVVVTYTNDQGVAGQTTPTLALTAPTVGRMAQFALQAGDNGVQKIESVTATVASAGTFNILVMRPLWTGRVQAAVYGDVHGPDKTGMPQVFADSALVLTVANDSTAMGTNELLITIGNG